MGETFLISKNMTMLSKRIESALKTEAFDTLQSVLNGLCGNVLTVGTGGSYASAVFAANIINEFEKDAFAIPVKPRDVLLQNLKKFDTVFLFSYSGTTNDIKSAYYACKSNGVKVFVVTALESGCEECIFERNEMISYHSDDSDFEERGFISMASMLTAMCLFAKNYYNGQVSFEEFLNGIFTHREQEFKERVIIPKAIPVTVDIFSGYDTATASAILESDITESGIGRATVHEKKDFSHGRYNALECKNPDYLVFLKNRTGTYTEKLMEYINGRSYNLFEITTDQQGVFGDFDLVVAVQFFVTKLSEENGYDMSEPVYPVEAKGLYKYSNPDLL